MVRLLQHGSDSITLCCITRSLSQSFIYKKCLNNHGIHVLLWPDNQIRHQPIDPRYPHIVRDEELPPCLQLPATEAPDTSQRCVGRNFASFEGQHSVVCASRYLLLLSFLSFVRSNKFVEFLRKIFPFFTFQLFAASCCKT